MSRTIEEKYQIALQMLYDLRVLLRRAGEYSYYTLQHAEQKAYWELEKDRQAGLFTVKIQGLPKEITPDIIRFISFDANNYPNITAASCLVSYRTHVGDYDSPIQKDMDALLIKQAPQEETP